MRQMLKRFCTLLLAFTLVLTLTACGGSGEPEETEAAPTFDFVVAGLSVDMDKTEVLRTTLPVTIGDLLQPGETVRVTELLMGEEANDTQVGIVMNGKAVSMFAGGMIDLMLTGKDTAAGYAAGDCLLPVDQVFTREELEELGLTAQSYDVLDSMDQPTGEKTQEVGLDVSHVESLRELLPGTEEVTLCIAANATDPQQCKEVIRRFVTE